VPRLRAGAIGSGNDNPEIFQYYYHSDHLGSTSLITDLDGNVVQHIEYVPFGEVFIEERNNRWNTPYLFNAKELDEETGLYYYGARYYDGRVSLWLGVDPMAEKYPEMSVYAYCLNNPIKFIDPDGMSTDVKQNDDGSYTVINASNDDDCNVYLADGNGKRTKEIVAITERPYVFLGVDDVTGEFSSAMNMTFFLDKKNDDRLKHVSVNGTNNVLVFPDKEMIINWGTDYYKKAMFKISALNIFGAKGHLAAEGRSIYKLMQLSKNEGILDIKESFGLLPYTVISAGTTAEGKPIITTLRAVGNELFGRNMLAGKPVELTSEQWYNTAMQIVGKYNQNQNKGISYNEGPPYYGEHTYSGSFIYKGYMGHFHK
jgi:RHS repeat-associated protein